MASEAHQEVVLKCPGADSSAVVRAAAISGSISALTVVAIFFLVHWVRRRLRATHAVAPARPPPHTVSPAPPSSAAGFYAAPPPTYSTTTPDFYAAPPPTYSTTTPDIYAAPPPTYSTTTPDFYAAPPPSYAPSIYAPPIYAPHHLTVVNNNGDGRASDVEMAAATVGYAAAAGTSAAVGCVIM